MIDINELFIVNYCHKSCTPLLNICRLLKAEAFSLACKMAEENPQTTAFYRFADFENYYPLRIKTDKYLYDLFVSLGGKPKEEHPLSFVLQGSEYLKTWFGGSGTTKIKIKDVHPDEISFTFGDSVSVLQKDGKLLMYTKETLRDKLSRYNGTIEEFIRESTGEYHYIEVQLWGDI